MTPGGATNHTDALARLQRIASACRKGRLIEPADGIALALAIDAVACGAARSLDAALDLLPRPGQRCASATLARQHRDELIRNLADSHFRDASKRAQAAAIFRAVRRHRTVPHHRDQDAAPDFIGQLAEMTVPGPRQLENILGAKRARGFHFARNRSR